MNGKSDSKSLTDPESFITSLPQDIIDDDSAETLDFVEREYKEYVSEEIMERIREKKLQDQNLSSDNRHQILACPRKILPIPEDSAKAETNIDYNDVYFDEEFDDDVYFDNEVASRSDKVEPGQRSSSNQALSHDDSDHSHNNYSEEEMPDESDDDRYNGCGGYNEYEYTDTFQCNEKLNQKTITYRCYKVDL
ncbi:17337_t:CDS:2 [Dentiscutata heterogama]|uniref:17337_t:CDS:1 n=1 Tax=Dentiscutata heterogama TaxID=1316150 RepID=A0ACA9KV50_9GLOM|nr:17337_t:CDS:2 [Dentiscutata heterogama]